MEQTSSSEANLFLTSQEILRIVWNPIVHHRFYKTPLKYFNSETHQYSPCPPHSPS